MVFRVFIFVFLFRNKVIREQFDESDFRCCYGNFFFESVIPKVFDQSYVQSSLSTTTKTLTVEFERHLTIEDFICVSSLHQDI